MPSLFITCPKTRQQADTGIMTDVESLRDTWSMTLNVNCPHCGEMHAVSVRETYIDDAIRNVSEISRRGEGRGARFGFGKNFVSRRDKISFVPPQPPPPPKIYIFLSFR